MSFICGADSTNVDLLYEGMPRIPDIGEEIYSKGFSLQLGGGQCATLINIARLGIKAKAATELGSDIFSDFAKAQYENAGVMPINLYNGDEIPLNITSAIILENDRSFVSYGKGGIEKSNAVKERLYEEFKGCRIALMNSSSIISLYKRLRADGALIILDTGWSDDLSIEKLKEYLETADYYVPNRKEALKITGADSVEDAAKVLSNYFDDVIIKLDSEGCLHYKNGEATVIPNIEEFSHVDSTGAGDAFLAGFAYGLYHGYSVKQSILFGNITGGKAVTKAGALSAYVTENELKEYYKKNSV